MFGVSSGVGKLALAIYHHHTQRDVQFIYIFSTVLVNTFGGGGGMPELHPKSAVDKYVKERDVFFHKSSTHPNGCTFLLIKQLSHFLKGKKM